MKTIAFLYPSPVPTDAVSNTFRLIERYAKEWKVSTCLKIEDTTNSDFVIIVTTAGHYTTEKIDSDIRDLKNSGKPFIVLHHNDYGQPSPSHFLGGYISSVWTRVGEQRLKERYQATFVRLPVFPPVIERHRGGLLLGTFGIVEHKKRILEIHKQCNKVGLPFIVHGPVAFAEWHWEYLEACAREGVGVCLHQTVKDIEEYKEWLHRCSHLIFVLGPSYESTGGGSMSPRIATLFNRSVIVIDDEIDYKEDGFTVIEDLGGLTRDVVDRAGQVRYDWGPDQYLNRLWELWDRRAV